MNTPDAGAAAIIIPSEKIYADSRSTVGLRGQIARIRASLMNPQLVGEGGAAKRYLKVQWWVTCWRLAILMEIPVFWLVSPDHIGPVDYALLLFGAGLIYTFSFSWLARQRKYGGRPWLHFVDIVVCSSLMLFARNNELIYITAFFAYSSLLARPTTNIRIALPSTVVLSLVYLAAEARTGISFHEFVASFYDLGDFLLFYFFGLGSVGFSAVLERASALELDSHLDEQRRSYRRRLHDDLGNTLCGLHFKIQSLKHSQKLELKQSLEFLLAGYERAISVLNHLVAGFEKSPTGDLGHSLATLKKETETGGLKVDLDLSPARLTLSPEVEREVATICREAVTNAIKHAHAGRVKIAGRKRGGRLIIVIADNGVGFDETSLKNKQSQGSMGIKCMQERAALLKGNLAYGSKAGFGTKITLEIKDRGRPKLIGKLLDYHPKRIGGGLYPFVVRLRLLMFMTMVFQLFLETGSPLSNPLVAAMTFILAIDCLAFVFSRDRSFRIISSRPRLLILEQAVFAAMYYVCLNQNVPTFMANYVGVSVIMNGSVFLGAVGNLALVSFLNAGIFLSYLLAPEYSLIVLQGNRFMVSVQECTTNFIVAVSAGLAGEFVEGLENLQAQAIGRALARQRERFSSETHRQLHSLVFGLGEDIRELCGRFHNRGIEEKTIKGLEARSNDVKNRLRKTLVSLEEPDGRLSTAQMASR